ncbi:MAG: T9SS type A sorting domain-containing protein [Chitinophagaceae bacterium]
MKRIFTLLFFACLLISINTFSQAFTTWNFNNSDTLPSSGTGIFRTRGSVTRSGSGFAAGVTGGGTDFGYNTTNFPAVSTGNASAGFEVATSTEGKTGIVISFYLRSSNTASRYFHLQYSTDGSTFIFLVLPPLNVSNMTEGTTAEIEGGLIKLTAGAVFNFVQVKLNSLSGVENNPNFKFRVVSAFAPGTSNYAAANSTSTYAPSGTVRIDNITVSSNNVLPVSLSNFSGALINNQPILNWQTFSEVNFSHFEVEKSTNANDFYGIGKVASKKNAYGSNYQFADNSKLLAMQYYRLKMIDNDGSFKRSGVIIISGNVKEEVSLFPNPAQSSLILNHTKAEKGASLRIFSLDGKAVGIFNIATGATQTSVDISNINKANYFVEFRNGNQVVTKQFSKK